jgi:hypothetical protein
VSDRAKHLLSITGISIFLAVIARQWSGLDTPDSSFYTSLAIFGDLVTDRAPVDSYYWTRLGYIAPVRALTSLTTPEIGFALYRLILITVLVTSIYLILLRLTRTNFTTRIFVTTSVASSSVILSYLGNPYLTGFILSATAAVIATALYRGFSPIVFGGVIIGWSAQVNPAGALLVGTLWVAVSVFSRAKLLHFVVAAVAAFLTFFMFIGLGTLIFPGLNWFETFNATRTMNLSDFASKDPVWLGDISLLVPLTVLLIAIKQWWQDRTNDAYRLALVISSVSIGFLLVFSPLMGGIAMEAPMYQSMLWPPAMIAMSLLFAPRISLSDPSRIAIAGIGVVFVMVAGFTQPTLMMGAGALIALGAVMLSIIPNTREVSVSALIVFIAILSSFQLLQNSRLDLGLYFLSPYSWAFAPNPIQAKISTAIDVQQWLINNTNDEDRILTWVDGDWTEGDRELYVVAAMQLWGENRLTLEPNVDEYARNMLDQVNPSVIALYGRSASAINTMWASLPNASPLTCIDFDWPVASNTRFPAQAGSACLTRLSLP